MYNFLAYTTARIFRRALRADRLRPTSPKKAYRPSGHKPDRVNVECFTDRPNRQMVLRQHLQLKDGMKAFRLPLLGDEVSVRNIPQERPEFTHAHSSTSSGLDVDRPFKCATWGTIGAWRCAKEQRYGGGLCENLQTRLRQSEPDPRRHNGA